LKRLFHVLVKTEKFLIPYVIFFAIEAIAEGGIVRERAEKAPSIHGLVNGGCSLGASSSKRVEKGVIDLDGGGSFTVAGIQLILSGATSL
jgi:hypothetical protein